MAAPCSASVDEASSTPALRLPVAGIAGGLTSHGSSAIVDPAGAVLRSALAERDPFVSTIAPLPAPQF